MMGIKALCNREVSIQPKLQECIGEDIFQLPVRTPGACLHFFKFYLFVCVFILGCPGSSLLVWAFSGCDKWVLLSSCGAQASHCGGSASCGLQSLQCMSSTVAAHGPSCLVACGIFLDQGWDCVPCAGRQILDHWTTREVQLVCILSSLTLLHHQHSNWDLRSKYCDISMCLGKKNKAEELNANPDSASYNLCILWESLTPLITQFSHLQI